MTFCETFRKNVARIECATHHERIYNACVWLKKRYILQRISAKCQRFFWVISRSSRPEVFFKRRVLENFAKFTGNPMYWSLFAVLQSAALFQKRDSSTCVFLWILRNFQEHHWATAWFFHYFKRGFSLCISFCRILW